MTDWETWARILDAAQDPQYRDAVQQFLAQAELSADLPAVLDEKFLAPRRAAGATGEECAYLLCNLGFAALASGTGEAATFAMACGSVADSLESGVPDLALRRHFLSAKGALQIAVITDQPHIAWAGAATHCADYLRAIDTCFDELLTQAVEGNVMAAYSFAGQCLVRMQGFHSIEHYASEVSGLVSAALELATRLPSALVNRLWTSIIPGTDAAELFRQAEAIAVRAMNSAAESEPGAADLGQAPIPDEQVVDNWCERWIDVVDDSHWTEQPAGLLVSADGREGWRLEAVAAAQKGDLPTALELVTRHEGFLVDSLSRDRARWADRLRNSRRPQADVSRDESSAEDLLEQAFEKLEPGTAILQSLVAGADILTLIARFQDGVTNIDGVTAKGTAFGLRESHKAWARACAAQDQMTAAWNGLASEIDNNWGNLFRRLLDDGVTQLVFAGDTYVGIPLHALEIDSEKGLLNEILPVTFTPSLATLRKGIESASTKRAAANVMRLDAPLNTDTKFPFNSTLLMDERDISIADIVARQAFSECAIVSGLCSDTVLPMTLRPPGFDPAGMFLAAGAGAVLESDASVDQQTESRFLQLFFDDWNAGKQTPTAFRQALRRLRADEADVADHQWAGWRLSGVPVIRE